MFDGERGAVPGRLLVLIEQLQAEGSYVAALRGDRAAGSWGNVEELLASIWDVLAATAMAGSKKKPPSYPRPGAKRAKKAKKRDIRPPVPGAVPAHDEAATMAAMPAAIQELLAAKRKAGSGG